MDAGAEEQMLEMTSMPQTEIVPAQEDDEYYSAEDNGGQPSFELTTIAQKNGQTTVGGTTSNTTPTMTEILGGIIGFPNFSEKTMIIQSLVWSAGSIMIPSVLLVAIPNSIRDVLEHKSRNRKWLLFTVAAITGVLYPIILIVIAVNAYYKDSTTIYGCPKPSWMMNPCWKKLGDWFKKRWVRCLMDVTFLIFCAYMDVSLNDAYALMISYMSCIHLLPMAKLVGITENIGLFDGVLSISLGTTLAKMKGHIGLRILVVLIICLVYQVMKHLNEHCRVARKKHRAATITADVVHLMLLRVHRSHQIKLAGMKKLEGHLDNKGIQKILTCSLLAALLAELKLEKHLAATNLMRFQDRKV